MKKVICAIALLAFALAFIACPPDPEPSIETVATPTANLNGGTYTAPQTVSLSCSTPGAVIYYTTDGSTPGTGSTAYAAAITINVTTTLKAVGIKDGMNSSEVLSVQYVIDIPEPEPVLCECPNGTVHTDAPCACDGEDCTCTYEPIVDDPVCECPNGTVHTDAECDCDAEDCTCTYEPIVDDPVCECPNGTVHTDAECDCDAEDCTCTYEPIVDDPVCECPNGTVHTDAECDCGAEDCTCTYEPIDDDPVCECPNGTVHTDAECDCDAEDCTCTYEPPINIPPTANAGTDFEHNITTSGATVTLNGSGTDTDGTITTYAWACTDKPNGSATPTFSNSAIANPTVSGFDILGDYEFSLKVTDNNNTESTADVVTVSLVRTASATVSISVPAFSTGTTTLNFTPVYTSSNTTDFPIADIGNYITYTVTASKGTPNIWSSTDGHVIVSCILAYNDDWTTFTQTFYLNGVDLNENRSLGAYAMGTVFDFIDTTSSEDWENAHLTFTAITDITLSKKVTAGVIP